MTHYVEFSKPAPFSLLSLNSLIEKEYRDSDQDHPLVNYAGTLENFKIVDGSPALNAAQDTLVLMSATVPTQEDLDAFAALLDQTPVLSARAAASSSIDKRTKELYSLGFIHLDGVLHSLSQNAQRTFLGMKVAEESMAAGGMFLEGLPVSGLHDNEATVLRGKEDLDAFFNSLMKAVAYCKASGTAIKRQLSEVTDIPTLQAFVDPRPLLPFDARAS